MRFYVETVHDQKAVTRSKWGIPPHGIFGSCTRYPRGLARWAELLGRRRRRRRHLEIQVDIQARELYLEFVPMDLDSDETSRDIDTAVLHRISIRI